MHIYTHTLSNFSVDAINKNAYSLEIIAVLIVCLSLCALWVHAWLHLTTPVYDGSTELRSAASTPALQHTSWQEMEEELLTN